MIFGRENAPKRSFYQETYEYLVSVGIPRLYVYKGLDNLVKDENTEGLIEFLTQYCKEIHLAFNDCINLTLYGANGTGKTLAGTIILLEAFRSNYSVRRIIFPNFLSDCFSFSPENEEDVHPLQLAINAEFLLIDEIGKETALKSDANISLLESVLKKREERGYPSIVCTNLTPELILKRYGNTVHSIISNQSVCVEFDLDDRRKDFFREKEGWKKIVGGSK